MTHKHQRRTANYLLMEMISLSLSGLASYLLVQYGYVDVFVYNGLLLFVVFAFFNVLFGTLLERWL